MMSECIIVESQYSSASSHGSHDQLNITQNITIMCQVGGCVQAVQDCHKQTDI